MSNYLNCAEAAALAPGNPAKETVWRWARHGVKARDGRRIHLDHVVVGTRIFITDGAIDRFIEALTTANTDHFEQKAEANSAANTLRSYLPPKRVPQAALDIQAILKRSGLK